MSKGPCFSWGQLIENNGARFARATSDDYFLTAFHITDTDFLGNGAAQPPCGWEIYLYASEQDVPNDFPPGKVLTVPLGSGRSQMAGVRIAAGITLTLEQAQQVAEQTAQILETHWRTVKAATVTDRLRSLYKENGGTLNMNAVRVWVYMNRRPITLKESAEFLNQPPGVSLYFTTLASITSDVFPSLYNVPEFLKPL